MSEERQGQEEVSRRDFLQAAKGWSAAVAALVLATAPDGAPPAAAWVNAGWVNRRGGGGGWINGAGGWVNRAGGWINGAGGGGGWVNTRGGGGGWINGGAGGWVNARGGGGGWINRR
jgi:hypothetical protein